MFVCLYRNRKPKVFLLSLVSFDYIYNGSAVNFRVYNNYFLIWKALFMNVAVEFLFPKVLFVLQEKLFDCEVFQRLFTSKKIKKTKK